MQLVIVNNKVIGTFRDDQQASGPEGAEIVNWQGAPPQGVYADVNGMKVLVDFPLDPRDNVEKLLSAKWRKLKEINAWDEATRLAGVAIGPYTLRYDDKGQQRVINLLAQIRELVDKGVVTANTLVAFEDAAGDTYKVKASVIRSAIQTYFTACQAQDEAVGDLKAQLKSAATIAEVDAIIVGG